MPGRQDGLPGRQVGSVEGGPGEAMNGGGGCGGGRCGGGFGAPMASVAPGGSAGGHGSACARASLGVGAVGLEATRKERVRQETREQVPALSKMRQTLHSYQLSFARMTSDALLTGWRPELEYTLQLLCDEVEGLERQEDALERMDALERQVEALKTQEQAHPAKPHAPAPAKPHKPHDEPQDSAHDVPGGSSTPRAASPAVPTGSGAAPIDDNDQGGGGQGGGGDHTEAVPMEEAAAEAAAEAEVVAITGPAAAGGSSRLASPLSSRSSSPMELVDPPDSQLGYDLGHDLGQVPGGGSQQDGAGGFHPSSPLGFEFGFGGACGDAGAGGGGTWAAGGVPMLESSGDAAASSAPLGPAAMMMDLSSLDHVSAIGASSELPAPSCSHAASGLV
jgi:hypothetical protein